MNETVIKAELSFPKQKVRPEELKKVKPDYGFANDQSIERKNMLAISEFVKKLERLVTDNVTSSDAPGRTLIHLKKFIIVPNNRTFWSLKQFAAPGYQDLGTTETVVMLGDEVRSKNNPRSVKSKEFNGVEESSKEDRNLIKEIIESVIRGEDLKRDEKRKIGRETVEDGLEDREGEEGGIDLVEVERIGSADVASVRDETPFKDEGYPRNVAGKNVDDQFLESNLEGGKRTSKKNNGVCAGDKSDDLEKRESAVMDNVRLTNEHGEHGGKKKNTKHVKKKRRRKRKRKKGKGDRNKKNNKKSKWPFKRNLLMLSDEGEEEQEEQEGEEEEEQIQPSNLDYGVKWKDRDKFSSREQRGKNMRSTKGTANESRAKEQRQIRGGQDCSDPRHPPNVDALKYLESAHCLRFSDMWFVFLSVLFSFFFFFVFRRGKKKRGRREFRFQVLGVSIGRAHNSPQGRSTALREAYFARWIDSVEGFVERFDHKVSGSIRSVAIKHV